MRDPVKQQEYSAKYRAGHRDELCEKQRMYSAGHHDEEIERSRKWRVEHHDEKIERDRKWRVEHHDEKKEKDGKWRVERRVRVLWTYGSRCEYCGESRYEFLAIDHVNGGGNAHRLKVGKNRVYAWLIENDFPEGFQVLCHNCNSAKNFYGDRKYKAGPRKKKNERGRKRRAKQRVRVLQAYGNRCACCGESEIRFLTMDHVNGGGTVHRRETGRGEKNISQWLIKNNFPEGFQVLCHNCNMAKGFYGKCPHEKEKEA